MKRDKLFRMVFIILSITGLIWISYNFYWKDIDKAGLYYSDEGYYVQIVKTHFYAIKYFKKAIFQNKDLGTLKDYLGTYGGPFFQNARQGYVLLISAISSLFLQEFYFYHGLRWSAFFGIASIFLFYFFILRNFGLLSALLSSLLLSVSSIYIAHARSALTISTAIFFLLLGIFCYFESFTKPRLLKFSALSFGVAFTCHYNVVWIFPLILLVEFYGVLYKRERHLSRIKVFAFFSSLPIIFIGIGTFLAGVILRVQPYFKKLAFTDIKGYPDYFANLLMQARSAQGYSELENSSFWYYLGLIANQHSLIFILAVISGIALILNKFIKTKDIKLFFLIAFILPFIFYSLIYSKVDRMILPFIPVFCAYIGISACFLKSKIKYLIFIPFIFIFTYQINMSKKALNYQMDISEALSYMNQKEGIKHISSRMYISHAYAGKKNAIDDFFYLGPTPGEIGKSVILVGNLQKLYNEGYHYYLWFYPDYRELAKTADKIAPERSYFRYYNIEGNFARIPNLKSNSMIEAIKIYNVKKIIAYLNHSRY